MAIGTTAEVSAMLGVAISNGAFVPSRGRSTDVFMGATGIGSNVFFVGDVDRDLLVGDVGNVLFVGDVERDLFVGDEGGGRTGAGSRIVTESDESCLDSMIIASSWLMGSGGGFGNREQRELLSVASCQSMTQRAT
jgi:hypothetical protein